MNKLKESDLPVVVALHMDSLPSDFVKRLGPGFLMDFWRYMGKSPQEEVWVARNGEERVVAVLMASYEVDTLMARSIKAVGWRFPFMMAMGLAKSFALWRAVLMVLRRLLKKHPSMNPEIVYLFTEASARGQGLGSQLLARMEEQARAKGWDTLYVKTYADSDHPAVGFYRKAGYVPLTSADAPGLEGYQYLSKPL